MLILEIVLFTTAIASVIGLGFWRGRQNINQDSSSRNYFLAGRQLTWYLIGFSLIAANISTEQFVGMAGKSSDWLGLAIASFEWFAAVTLVLVAFIFLPRFLQAGIYTVPEFLEYRYGVLSRVVMAVVTLVVLVGVPTASVIYSGAKVISGYYSGVPVLGDLEIACWLIAVLAAGYIFIGGLKSCAWTDLIWGGALIIGGAIITALGFQALESASPEHLIISATGDLDASELENAGAWERFVLLNGGSADDGGKLHMIRPIDDPEVPWSTLLLGLWIPNLFYWGLNQYIVQRALGAKSLIDGQKGIIFAAFLKLIIPFIVVIPGILAFNLFHDQFSTGHGGNDHDSAFPILLSNLIKPHPLISWFVLAAIFGAVVSSLASMLNSASTIATMDLVRKWFPRLADHRLPNIGRAFVLIFMIIAALIAPSLATPNFGGVYTFIQEFQGFVSPGVIVVFIFGIMVPRAPRFLGWSSLVLNAVLYALLKWWIGPLLVNQGLWFSDTISFLDRMAICFFIVCLFCWCATMLYPLEHPVDIPVNNEIDLRTSPLIKFLGVMVVFLTILLYVIFW